MFRKYVSQFNLISSGELDKVSVKALPNEREQNLIQPSKHSQIKSKYSELVLKITTDFLCFNNFLLSPEQKSVSVYYICSGRADWNYIFSQVIFTQVTVWNNSE